MVCVICMNYIHLEVDESGGLVPLQPAGSSSMAGGAAGRSLGLRFITFLRDSLRMRTRGANSAAASVVAESELQPMSSAQAAHVPLNTTNSADSPPASAAHGQLISPADSEVADSEITEVTEEGEASTRRKPAASGPDLESLGATATSASSAPPEEENVRLCKKYMKTPCNHNYHIVCLKKWMEVRMRCPQCRQDIPMPDDD